MRFFVEVIAVFAFLGSCLLAAVWVMRVHQLRTMTIVERAKAAVDETSGPAAPSLAEQIRTYLVKQGFGYGLGPAAIAWTLIYLGTVVVLKVFGFPLLVALVVGVFVATLGVWVNLLRLAQSRRRAFNRQFIDAMKLVANQLSAGSGPQRAIEQIIPSLSEPLRSELSAAMDSALISRTMVSALAELQTRYPSDAFKLFVTALELNRDANSGGRLEPTIRRAAEVMLRNYELGNEAVTEIAQVRAEFWGVLGIICLIGLFLFHSSSLGAHAAYTSVGGIIVLSLAAGWAALGTLFTMRMFSKARGDV